MNILKKITPILFVVVMLFGMIAATTPSVAAAESIPGCKQWHTVQSGEYLTKIANLYNTTWSALVEINNLEDPDLIFVGQKLCVSLTNGSTTPTNNFPNTGSGVRIYASGVKEDQTVTLQGKYLVANTSYAVYLSNFKANHPVDYWIGSVTAGKDGSFKVTYNIPKKLYDVTKVRISITNGKGDTASNWFYNITAEGNTGGIGAPTLNFTIVSVVEDKTVKIQANNLIANATYKVYMGKAGTEGVDGVLVGTVSSTKGGTVTATFDIPETLRDRSKLDLRLENGKLELSAFLTFENKNK